MLPDSGTHVAGHTAMLFWCMVTLTCLVTRLQAAPLTASSLGFSSADSASAFPTRSQYGRVGHLTTLTCLVNGTSDVTWCKMTPDNESCSPFPWGSGPSWLDDHKIESKSLWLTDTISQDKGLYRCASPDSKEQIALKVYECDSDRGIEKERPPEPRVAAPLGAPLSLTCSAYFGCPASFNVSLLGQELARWNWSSLAPSLEPPRLSLQNWPLDPDTMKASSVLTLRHVIEEDYGVKFQCNLGKGILYDTFTVEIIRPEKLGGDYWRLAIALVSPLALLLIAAPILRCCWWSVVKYHCLPCGRPRRGSGEVYDALLLTTETTEQFAKQHLKHGLENYRLQEVPPNSPVLSFPLAKLPQCACVIVVRAINEEDATWRFLAHATCQEKGTSKVVLVVVPDQDTGLSSSLPPRRDRVDTREDSDSDACDSVFLPSKEDGRGAGTHSGERGAEMVGRTDGEGVEATLAACTTLHWPGNGRKGRRMWNFWCALRYALPRPEPPSRKDRDVSRPPGHSSTSSGSYLLHPSSSRSDHDVVSP